MNIDRLLQLMGLNARNREGRFVGRSQSCDDGVAFTFRMGGGIAGDVTRTHPAPTIEPALVDAAAPPTAYGQAVIADITSTDGVRIIGSGDSGLTAIFGITVRPYPIQQQSTTNYGNVGFGNIAPATSGEIDILKRGYISVSLPAGSSATYKGSSVWVWYAAASGAHVQGGFESSSGASTIALGSDIYFNGPADSTGIVELAFRV